MLPFTYRDSVALIRTHGGIFLKHGSNHDLFRMPTGLIVPVPRHRGDLSRGVEASIRRSVRSEKDA